MLKVMIVDDERMISESIKAGIDWNDLEMHIAKIASDSREALDYAKQHYIDIIITDISMPPFNGLTLCQELLELNPDLKMIVISGYADFSYAQKAIGLGVVGYCLKPINYQEMTLMLQKAKVLILEDDQIYRTLSEEFIEYIYENNVGEMQKYLTQKKLKNPVFLAVSVGKKVVPVIGEKIVLGREQIAYLTNQPFGQMVDISVSDDQDIRQISYTKTPVALEDISSVIKELQQLAYRFFFDKNICWVKYSGQSYEFSAQPLLKVLDDREALASYIKSLQWEKTYAISIHDALHMHNLITNYYSELNEDSVHSLDEFVMKYENFSMMLRYLIEAIETTQQEIEASFDSYNINFLKAVKYINENYTKNLSVKDIGETLYLNPNYISQLFKKETGMTYSQYVTQLKMNHAKHMLTETNKSIQEICEASGFNDYFYFIKRFKKYYKQTPSKYREERRHDYEIH